MLENYSNALEILYKNIKKLKCDENCKISNTDCFEYLERLQNKELKIDLIFLDPPYKEKKINKLIEKIFQKKY